MADENLISLLSQDGGIQTLVDALNADLIPAAVVRYNSEFSVRYFGRPPAELIPTEKRHLTEFRTRLGTLLEYGMGVTIDAILKSTYGPSLRLAFVVNHQYPDFYLRDAAGAILLRIDCKVLHDESAEYSARFDLPTGEISPERDLLLYLAWQWRHSSIGGHDIVHPYILEGLVVPAIEIARERDMHLLARGGHFEAGRPVVPPVGAPDTNFGKINRIVHTSRRESDLTPNVRAFLEFTRRHADAVARVEAEAGLTPDEASPE